MNIGYNKKGLYFITITIVAVSLIIIAYSFDRMIKEKEVVLEKIGESSVAVINSFYEGERLNYFVGESSKYSIIKALSLMGENGGIYDIKSCDIEEETVIWNDKCQPDNLKENFENYFDDSFKDYLKIIDLEIDNFNFEFDNNLNLKLESKEEIRINIKGDSEKQIDIEVEEEKLQVTLKRIKDYMNIIEEKSLKYNVPQALIISVITQESMGDVNAVSEANCNGLMQICPGPHPEYYDLNYNEYKCNAGDSIECNIEAGTEILKRYYNKYKIGVDFKCEEFCDEKGNCQGPIDKTYYNWEAALRAYHGLGCGGYPDYTYVEKVLRYYDLLGGEKIRETAKIMGSYFIKLNSDFRPYFDLRHYSEVKKVAEACLKDNICLGTVTYNLVENYPSGDFRIFNFESKKEILNIKPITIKFALPIEK